MVRMILKSFLLGGSLLPLTLALPRHDIQNLKKGYGPSGSTAAERAQAVIDVFRFSWEGYYNYAFPNDELRPVSNSWGNSRYGTRICLFEGQTKETNRDHINMLLETAGVLVQ